MSLISKLLEKTKGEPYIVLDGSVRLDRQILSYIEHDGLGSFYDEMWNLWSNGVYYINPNLISLTTGGRLFLEEKLSLTGRTIPSYILHNNNFMTIEHIDSILPSSNQLYVKKNLMTHGGLNLEVYHLNELLNSASFLREFDIIQPLIIATDELGYQCDYRTLIVGEKPISMYSRKAAKPLTKETGELIEQIPLIDRVMCNQVHDDVTIHNINNYPVFSGLLIEIAKYVRQVEEQFRLNLGFKKQLHNLDYLSIDWLFTETGPLICEIHLRPAIKNLKEIQIPFAQGIVNHLKPELNNYNLMMLGINRTTKYVMEQCDIENIPYLFVPNL